ncbi:MAG: ShlB/FhaC/HecB family hemolysin secretion/activation protein [Sphingomonadales bacterium]
MQITLRRAAARGGTAALAALLAGLAASPAAAQVTPGVAPGSTARPPTAQELDRAPPPAAVQAPRASVRSRGFTAGPCPEALANSSLTAPLSAVAFSGPGGAALPPAIAQLLAGIGKGLDGRPLPLAEICRIRDDASAALAAARYVAVVQVPEQTLADGVLKLRVTTAHITELRVRGEPGKGQARLSALLARLKTLDPLNETEAERILLLANDIPGTQVSLELRPAPSGVAGEVIGEIQLQRTPGSLVMNVQNYGSEQIGRWSGVLRGDIYGLTGRADRTYLSVFSTSDARELVVVQAGHDMAVGNDGLRAGISGTYAKTRPTLPNAAAGFNLTSESVLASLFASYPLIRTTASNLKLGGGLDLIDQRTRALGQLINLDQIRTGWLRIDGDTQPRRVSLLAPAWRLGSYLELRQGLPVLGATPRGGKGGSAIPTRFEGNARAFVARAGISGEGRVRFGGNQALAATLAFDLRGQWTNSPLLAYDEFAVGNLTLGRGYDPGATAGDRMIGGSTEFRLGKPVPLSAKDVAIEAIGFYDHVKLRNLDSNKFEENRTLRSVGGGVRATWGSHVRLDLVYARPLDKALAIDTVKPGGRVLLSLTVRALPWR